MSLLVSLLVFVFLVLSSRLAFVVKRKTVFAGQYVFVTAFLFILLMYTHLKYGFSIYLIPVILSGLVWVSFTFIYHRVIENHINITAGQGDNIKEIKKKFSKVSKLEKQLEDEIGILNFQLDQTSSIYKATLKMSSTLDFDETLDSFVMSLSAFEGFNKLHLIVSMPFEENDNSEQLVSFFFDLNKNTIQQYPTGRQEEILMTRMNGERKIQTVSDCLAFGIHPGSFEINRTSIASIVPLFFQNEFLGVLVYFSDRIDYIDQLELLGLHFSMELHKSRLYEKIKKLSTIDSLSSTYLKRHFFPLFDEEIIRHEELKQELALMLIDIDYFKQVNDKNGHLMGDTVIREVAREIRLRCREEDLIGRFGGDEFMIVLPGATQSMAFQIADRIRTAIKEILFNQDSRNEFKVSVSIGISMFPHHGKNRKDLFEAVDEALYRAKENGRDRIEVQEIA